MSLATLLKMVKAAGEKAYDTLKDLMSGDSPKFKRILGIAALVFFVLNLPNLAIVGLFGWMGSVDADSILIDTSYAELINGTVIEVLYDENYPDNIPWPDESLIAIGEFQGLSFNTIEMCNVIYHTHLFDPQDSITTVLEKYDKLVKCFSEATEDLPYRYRLFNAFEFYLLDDEVQVLNEELNYIPPWEENQE